MCLLIESFSLDRAACFLPSREIAFCPSRSFSLSLVALLRALFSSSTSRRYVRIARGISVARVSQTGEVALNRRGDWEPVFVFRKRFS